MIYEVRTYRLRPGTLAQCEAVFGERLGEREKFSKLGAFWHTEVGQLNEIIHVWPYDNLDQRIEARTRAMKSGAWPPPIGEFIEEMKSEIFIPTPFMEPLVPKQLGPVYEIRTYHYKPGSIPVVIERWKSAIESRTKLSPLTACWFSDIGDLNKFVHIWPYASLDERSRVRADAAKLPAWPPDTKEFLVSQENKIVAPSSFSPLQ